MKLLQLCAGQIRLNQPLPWNVRTAASALLLSKGHLIASASQLEALLERGMYVDEDEYERHRRESEAAQKDDPFYAWAEMTRRTAALLRNPRGNPQFRGQVGALCDQLRRVTARDPDVGSFELAHMEQIGYPALHSLQSAYLATLVCRRLDLGPEDTQSAVQAALTMNVSMIDLQAALCAQPHPPNEEQRAAIESHPQRSHDLLVELGVADRRWLEAVRLHHVADDGSGYPAHQGEPPLLARVLRHCDIYLAKVSARRTRPAMPVHEAARSFFQQRGGANNPVAAAIVKETGIYPPGSYVKLANGDVAVVVRRGENANAPLAYSLANAQGIPFAEPVRRDTRQERFKVLAPVPPAAVMVRVDRARLFAG